MFCLFVGCRRCACTRARPLAYIFFVFLVVCFLFLGPGCLGRLSPRRPCARVPVLLARGLVLAFFVKSNEKWCCEIMDDPWWFLDELVLVGTESFPLLFEGFEDFAGFLCAAGPLVPVVPLASVFPVFCGECKGGRGQGEIEITSK